MTVIRQPICVRYYIHGDDLFGGTRQYYTLQPSCTKYTNYIIVVAVYYTTKKIKKTLMISAMNCRITRNVILYCAVKYVNYQPCGVECTRAVVVGVGRLTPPPNGRVFPLANRKIENLIENSFRKCFSVDYCA